MPKPRSLARLQDAIAQQDTCLHTSGIPFWEIADPKIQRLRQPRNNGSGVEAGYCRAEARRDKTLVTRRRTSGTLSLRKELKLSW